MIGKRERVDGCGARSGTVAWAGVLALLAAMPVAAQVQPPDLDVYSNQFAPSSGAAPGASSGDTMLVDVPGIDPLEVRLDELRQLMADHLAETDPHWPHYHPHGQHTDPVVSAPGHSELIERLARLVSDLLLRTAHAQGQPAPLQVYNEEWDGPNAPAPAGATGPPARLVTDVPMLDEIDAQLRQLHADINAHVADGNAHPHDHAHGHGAGGTQFFPRDRTDTDGDGVVDLDDFDPDDPDVQYDPLDQTDTDGDGVRDVEDADPNDPDVQFHPADETDTDGDGVIDVDDADPNDPDVQ